MGLEFGEEFGGFGRGRSAADEAKVDGLGALRVLGVFREEESGEGAGSEEEFLGG